MLKSVEVNTNSFLWIDDFLSMERGGVKYLKERRIYSSDLGSKKYDSEHRKNVDCLVVIATHLDRTQINPQPLSRRSHMALVLCQDKETCIAHRRLMASSHLPVQGKGTEGHGNSSSLFLCLLLSLLFPAMRNQCLRTVQGK